MDFLEITALIWEGERGMVSGDVGGEGEKRVRGSDAGRLRGLESK